jgi:hypothetical protein
MNVQRGVFNRVMNGQFSSPLTGSNGPTPGTITAQLNHTVVSLADLVTPGLCRIENQDTVNSVYVGVYSSHFNEFFPLLMLKAGESYPVRLADLLGKDLSPGTGTGGDAFTFQLALKAVGAPVIVLVEALDN